MSRVRLVSDPEEGERLWRQSFPCEMLWDLWEVRACFHAAYLRPLHFQVLEEGGVLRGLLPLCWIVETRGYGYFPGEVWAHKTWLEGNRIFHRTPEDLGRLLAACPPRHYIRYLHPLPALPPGYAQVDEIGYLLDPPQLDFSFDRYIALFSRRSWQQIQKDVAHLTRKGVTYRLDRAEDFELLVELNLGRFGAQSYFADPRFTQGFRALVELLAQKGWLRMTTVLLGGVPAAVDLGCLYRGTYTLLAGGTHNDSLGVAKLINLHHVRRACDERFDRVDFLCGDFSWKARFRLRPRPLYLIADVSSEALHGDEPSRGPDP